MALNAFLRIKGGRQGDIRGSVTQRGREGRILVIGAEHQLTSPREAASGRATGKRVHTPFIITKELDRASPLLYQMLATNEAIVEWELQFWAGGETGTAGRTGIDVQRYTVTLQNATIVAIKFRMPNTQVPESAKLSEYEEVSFAYQKITWTWTEGAVQAQDDWAGAV